MMNATEKSGSGSSGRTGLRACGLLLALVCAALFGRSLPSALRPAPDRCYDYFKEWSTARNVLEGRPAYSDLREAFLRETGAAEGTLIGHFDQYNTHPPASVWLGLPFATLPYRDAHLAFNLVSLVLFATGLVLLISGQRSRPGLVDVLIFAGLLCACDPLRQSLIQGQPNLVLFFLLALAWRLESDARGEKPSRLGNEFGAGLAIGVATAIKLFPGLLGLRALVLRRWGQVLGAAIGFGGVSLATLAVVGIDGYRDYLTKSLPWVRSQTNNWGNVSILAFWERLLGEPNGAIQPVLTRPDLAQTLATVTALLVLGGLVWLWIRGRRWGDATSRGEGFAAAVLGMLLLSPMVWVHTLLLAGVAWSVLREVRGRSGARSSQGWLWILVVCLWLSPRLVWNMLIPARHSGGAMVPRVARPWQSLTALSFQTYALVAGLAISAGRGRSPFGGTEADH